jgi:amidase
MILQRNQDYGGVWSRCPGGLPIGMQVVAHPWREDVALAVAERVEKVLGGWRPPPI